MRVLTEAPAPKDAEDTIHAAAAYQMIADFTVKAAGFKPRIQIRGVDAPRVYVELAHPDTWVVNTNDPDHPELEKLVVDAVHQHLTSCKISLAEYRAGNFLTTDEFLQVLKVRIDAKT